MADAALLNKVVNSVQIFSLVFKMVVINIRIPECELIGVSCVHVTETGRSLVTEQSRRTFCPKKPRTGELTVTNGGSPKWLLKYNSKIRDFD